MTLTIAVLSDIHGNLAALDAVLVDIATRRPDRLWVAGDLLLGGPRPAEVVARLQELERNGRLHRGRQHRHRGDRRRLRGGLPVARRGAGGPSRRRRVGTRPARRTTSSTGSAGCPSSGVCGMATRSRCWCTPRPAARPRACPADLDPSTTVERVTRTDARVICCGHTHVADIRELGRKLIVNPGACGWAFDGDPAAGWALVRLDDDAPTRRAAPGDLRRADASRRRSRRGASRATCTGPPRCAPAGSSGERATTGRHHRVSVP